MNNVTIYKNYVIITRLNIFTFVQIYGSNLELNVIHNKKRKHMEKKTLKEKLTAAVNKILQDNKSELTNKIEKVVNRSIKKIVRKTDKQIKMQLKVK